MGEWFSKRNLELIRKCYRFYSENSEIAKQAVSQLFLIPWGHNIAIMKKELTNIQAKPRRVRFPTHQKKSGEKMRKKIATIALISATFIGCTHSPKIVFPDKGYQDIEWSKSEKERDIAIRHLSKNEYSSSHLIRLKGQEPPHYHDNHNLMVSMISGESILHFKDHEVVLYEGDVITIPKGVYHWAENIDSEASVVFATFSPAFRGVDRRLAK